LVAGRAKAKATAKAKAKKLDTKGTKMGTKDTKKT